MSTATRRAPEIPTDVLDATAAQGHLPLVVTSSEYPYRTSWGCPRCLAQLREPGLDGRWAGWATEFSCADVARASGRELT